jgi:hypothetical protein
MAELPDARPGSMAARAEDRSEQEGHPGWSDGQIERRQALSAGPGGPTGARTASDLLSVLSAESSRICSSMGWVGSPVGRFHKLPQNVDILMFWTVPGRQP